MKKLKSTLPNMILSLGLISILSGGLIGLMYSVTKEPIEKAMAESQTAAISQVLPEHDNNPEAESENIDAAGKTFTLYPARLDGRIVGAAVRGTSMDGFSGEVTIISGFNAAGDVTDYKVLTQAETPGLGAKMEEWFRDPSGARSIIGKSPGKVNFRPSKDGGDIDGITAATISSRAFLNIVREAYSAYMAYKGVPVEQPQADASSGASSHGSKHEDDVKEQSKTDAASGASSHNHHQKEKQ